MGSRRNVITLNGNRYDAVTGQLLDDGNKKIPKKQSISSSNVEGFVAKPTKKPIVSRNPQNISRTAHKSKTLMRKVVSKPVPKKIESQPSNQNISGRVSLNPSREIRAKAINKSSLISRFGSPAKSVSKTYSNLPLSTPPKSTDTKTQNNEKTINLNNGNSRPTPNKNQQLMESAIKNAQSHKEKKTKRMRVSHRLAKKLKVKPSFLNISMFVLTGILLTTYFAYNNIPNIAMRVASTRSGINGSVPDYQASGFSFKGPIQYKTGEIKITYKSNSDDRTYDVIQRNTEWNSDALLSNHVATNDRTYQILQEKGKTIYVYDGDNASWVDNGIWYEIKGDEALSASQVIKIANSL